MKRESMYEDQAERQKKFPPDRIAFRSTEEAVAADRKVFERYMNFEISRESAKNAIAKNNYLDEVTDEQFFCELMMCGYYTRRGQ